MIRLLAEALDWHDDQVPTPEKGSVLADVRCYHRHFASCPSCKLMLILMKFIIQKDNHIEQDYYSRTISSAHYFESPKTRKIAIQALLSHWQTIICNQIQLADLTVADGYKCMPDSLLLAVDEVPVIEEKPKDDKKADTLKTESQDIEKGNTADEKINPSKANKPSLSRGSTSNQFQPGHRRGASTATNMSVGANDKQPCK